MSIFRITEEFFGGAVKVISPTKFGDNRGFYSVSYREDEFKELGLPYKFVQYNHSRSAKDVVRGLHFQFDPPMGKVMRVTVGEAFLVAVDLRRQSPTFLKWVGLNVSEDNMLQVWAPAEFARGFCTLSDRTEVQYQTTGLFDAKTDSAIRWDDPNVGVDWPVSSPILSEKDLKAPTAAVYFGIKSGIQ